MNPAGRFQGTLAVVLANWPTYLLLYGGGAAAALLVIVFSAGRGWWAFVALAFAVLLILSYYFAASLWAAYKVHDDPAAPLDRVMVDLGQLKPGDTFVHVDLGTTRLAVALSRHLTTGQVIVVDVYHPLLSPSPAVARARQQARRPKADRRLTWRDGTIDLLPMPDGSLKAVTIGQVLSELWQEGDRRRLLGEVFRVLAPGGRLLLVERPRSQTNWAVFGPAALSLRPPSYWRGLLSEAGFQLKKEQAIHDLVTCFRADRPPRDAAEQLRLNLRA
jgi:SAM-dependent methyltransferase